MSRDSRNRRKNTMRMLALLAILLLIMAIVGVVAFLKDRGSAQAVGQGMVQSTLEEKPIIEVEPDKEEVIEKQIENLENEPEETITEITAENTKKVTLETVSMITGNAAMALNSITSTPEEETITTNTATAPATRNTSRTVSTTTPVNNRTEEATETTATTTNTENKNTDNNIKTEEQKTSEEQTELEQKNASYSVKYYFNGEHNSQYDIPSSETQGIPVGTSFSFANMPSGVTGYEYIAYTIDGVENANRVIKDAENEVKVYLGKPVVTVSEEVTTLDVNAGDNIEYKIKVKNTGHVGVTTNVTDILEGATYNNDSNVEATFDSTSNKLTWSVELGPVDTSEPTKTNVGSEAEQIITFSAKTPNNAVGHTVLNKVEADAVEEPATITTKLNEISVDYNEIIEGKEGTDLNYIFIVANSSSMNKTAAGQTFENDDDHAFVAPGDREKTRIENTKSALNSFINEQSSNPNNTMTVMKFNTYYTNILKTENPGYDVSEEDVLFVGYNEALYLTETDTTITYYGDEYTLYKCSDGNDYIIINFFTGTYAYKYNSEDNTIGAGNVTSTSQQKCIWVNGERIVLRSEDISTAVNNTMGQGMIGTSIDGTKYIIATDNKAYEFVRETTTQGLVLGTTLNGEETNSELITAVNTMTIGDVQAGYKTYIYPALEAVNDYIDETKTNIVIVLTDSEFNDENNNFDQSKATDLLRSNGGNVDSIYSIAFGEVSDTARTELENITNIYEKDANGNNTTTKKVYEANNTSTLLSVFNTIKEEETIETKNDETTVGEISIEQTQNEIIISETCPIKVIDTDTDAVVLTCTSESEMELYGLSFIDTAHTKVNWNSNAFITNNPDEVTDLRAPQHVKLTYYVPYNK